MTTPSDPGEWSELDDVLRGHCAQADRDPAEITRSIHLAFDEDDDVAELRDQAAAFFDVGVDVVVWSMRGAVDARRLEPLAAVLT
jgi:hypothetical protein